MTDRELPTVDGSPACPFVAFEDDRDARSTSPDHRHRCFAEVRPAERAFAHQEAYCLSGAFPVCPTFQDWARREAASARPAPARPDSGSAGNVDSAGADNADNSDHFGSPGRSEEDASSAGREPRRGWSEPPPWATPAPPPGSLWEEADDDRGESADADSLADLPRPRRDAAPPVVPPRWKPDARRFQPERDDQGSSLNEASDPDLADDQDSGYEDEDPMERSARRRAEREARHRAGVGSSGGRRPVVGQSRPRPAPDERGPSWERPRRFEAYPTIKTRIGLPAIPRLAVVAAAIVLAGVGLFILPTLLGVGGPDGGATPSPTSAGASSSPGASVEPTPIPEPTPIVYEVQPNDTMSKIAKRFGVSLSDLIAANKDTIPDPNKIKIGDKVTIPAAAPTEFVDPGASGSLPPP
ncbi:MAG: LysM domain-containing protein [Chloroflexota bacterium]